jgi:hypothetical protein
VTVNERRTSHTLITNICFRNVRLHRDDTYPYTLDHTAIPHFHALFPSTHDGRSFPVCSRPQVLGTPACDPQAPRVCAHYKKATGAVSSWFTYMPVISFPGVQPAQVPHPVSTDIGQVLSPPAGVLAGDVYRAPGGGRKTLWAPGADGVDTVLADFWGRASTLDNSGYAGAETHRQRCPRPLQLAGSSGCSLAR